MKKILSHAFFKRSAPIVAKELLGKYLICRINGVLQEYLIRETEAYDGLDDLASHASKGKTKRTEVMFGKAGILYVYLIYGMYWMLNVVTGNIGHPGAVLIRGLDGISGPGRLTRQMNITNAMNGLEAKKENNIWFEDRGIILKKSEIMTSPRIGVSYAGPIWSQTNWRFVWNKK